MNRQICNRDYPIYTNVVDGPGFFRYDLIELETPVGLRHDWLQVDTV